jgi:hypothetical protein
MMTPHGCLALPYSGFGDPSLMSTAGGKIIAALVVGGATSAWVAHTRKKNPFLWGWVGAAVASTAVSLYYYEKVKAT